MNGLVEPVSGLLFVDQDGYLRHSPDGGYVQGVFASYSGAKQESLYYRVFMSPAPPPDEREY